MLWLAFGAFANIARISRIPGARVARALWVSATRPWRAAEVVAGMSRLDRILLAAIPAVAIVLTELITTWFLAPAHLVVTLSAWSIFAAIVVGFARSARWAVVAASAERHCCASCCCSRPRADRSRRVLVRLLDG